MAASLTYQLSDYLEKLPGTTFRKLYQQPSTALAIFRRMLPDLAKTLVLALLYSSAPLPLVDLDAWLRPGAKKQRDQALGTLRALHMVQISAAGRDRPPQEVQLTTNFKNSLRLALEGGGDHDSFGVPSTLPVDAVVDVASLDRYARRKWEEILHYVVNSVGQYTDKNSEGSGPQASVKDLLLAGKLVERRSAGSAAISITQAGFTFLLQEANAQVWTLLLLWIEAAERTAIPGMDAVDMLSLLFMLGSLELGRAYDVKALGESRRRYLLPSLVDFGLVFMPSNSQQFFPTRLATTLTSSASALKSVSSAFSAATQSKTAAADALTLGPAAGESKGFIIVETNLRLYAYTSSPLQIAVLGLFVDLKMRFQGMVAGRLKRESIRRAVSYGITAEQIISYMQTHAHDQMVRSALGTGRPTLPPTVVDQIRLWQLETERMTTTPGFLFKDFGSYEEYADMARYADEIGVLTWRNDQRSLFFVTKLEQVRDFMKARKKG